MKKHSHYHKSVKGRDTIDGGWIGWKGGDCPVGEKTIVTVLMRDGAKDVCMGGLIRWNHLGVSHDVIAYKVVRSVE